MKGFLRLQFVLLFVFMLPIANAEWDVDFSRRVKEIRHQEYIRPHMKKEKGSMFDFVFSSGELIQEVVVLNTERGFVPSTIRVQEGRNYKIHVVNINEKEKNVSFVLDSFSEHHATYYGKIKSFYIKPKKEGVYTFQSPETSAQGRLVVYPRKKKVNSIGSPEIRSPAAE